MKDQVLSLTRKGLTVLYTGEVSDNDDQLVTEVHEGRYQVLFFSPESLLRHERWRDMLLSTVYKKKLVGLIVDEAHCVKKW